MISKNSHNEEALRLPVEGTERARALMSYYKCAMMEIETKFSVLDEQFSLNHDRNPIDSISTRLKSSAGILEKLHRKGLPVTLEAIEENVRDVAGVRVLCSFEDDIYTLRDCLVSQDDITLIAEKDYIKEPKPNGYRSLHLIVEVPIFLQNEKKYMKVEVQLRTVAMEFWANIEHQIRYKKNLTPEVAAKIADDLLQCAKISEQLDKMMSDVKKIADGES